MDGGRGTTIARGTDGSLKITRDEKSSRSYLQIPMPDPDVLDQALQAVGSWLENLRR